MKEEHSEMQQKEYIEDETTIYEVDLECLKGQCPAGKKSQD
ncbi:MAG: hypothetical protein ACI4SQ_00370 [Eubacterium sp.]